MNNVTIKVAALGFAMFSASAFAADKIVITGEPIMLQKQGEMYILPDNFTQNQNTAYQYVMLEGQKRACFVDKRPEFSSLDVVAINVKVAGNNAVWNCYALDPNFFVIQDQMGGNSQNMNQPNNMQAPKQ